RHSSFRLPCLQHASFLEAEISGAPFQWRADNDVIEQFDLQKLRGLSKAPRQTVIGLARRSIPRGMIVHHDYCIGRISNCGPKNFARMSDALVHASQRDRFHAYQSITSVEQNNAQ